MERALVLCWIYPEHMNLYGDRGNIIVLEWRSALRGIRLEVARLGPRDPFDGGAYDLVFTGGGPDSTQTLVADDLRERKAANLRAAIVDGLPALAVCGGYQLFANSYRTASGEILPGAGIFEAETVHPGVHAPRCVGNIVITWNESTVVGFENHGGRTFLGPGLRPFGTVLRGHGNNSKDGTEGAVFHHCYGSYIHGSLLPKNPHLADHLLGLALDRKYGSAELQPLDDQLEWEAHRAAIARAGG